MVSMWLTNIDMATQWFTIFAYIWILKLLSPLGSSGLFQTQVRMLFFQTQSGDLGGAGMVPFSRRWDGYWGYFPFQLTTGYLLAGDWNHGILNDFPIIILGNVNHPKWLSLTPSFFRGVGWGRAQPLRCIPQRGRLRLRIRQENVFTRTRFYGATILRELFKTLLCKWVDRDLFIANI